MQTPTTTIETALAMLDAAEASHRREDWRSAARALGGALRASAGMSEAGGACYVRLSLPEDVASLSEEERQYVLDYAAAARRACGPLKRRRLSRPLTWAPYFGRSTISERTEQCQPSSFPKPISTFW
jgi:hypothetical protein